ncbi:peptidoglycan-binding domain-containing protein [Streptomyces sp. NPDC048404]|uniref:peptidoglycan-binding domain-containing protein n=1 Tax=unclassified Streptomyces TaxID=2593676 RepID=UPI00343B5B6F
MNLRTKNAKLAGCAVGALSAIVLVLSASPASASGTYSGLPYVHGAASPYDDFGDEGVTDINTNRTSNATCLWQMTLWANGYLSSKASVDGDFGSQTRTATANYQSDAHLQVDGSAGKQSWSYAGVGQIRYVSGSNDSTLTLAYEGLTTDGELTGRNFSMKRDASGDYQFIDGDGAWRYAGYNYRTCS